MNACFCGLFVQNKHNSVEHLCSNPVVKSLSLKDIDPFRKAVFTLSLINNTLIKHNKRHFKPLNHYLTINKFMNKIKNILKL